MNNSHIFWVWQNKEHADVSFLLLHWNLLGLNQMLPFLKKQQTFPGCAVKVKLSFFILWWISITYFHICKLARFWFLKVQSLTLFLNLHESDGTLPGSGEDWAYRSSKPVHGGERGITILRLGGNSWAWNWRRAEVGLQVGKGTVQGPQWLMTG